MPRELTNLEIDDFLNRHPDVWDSLNWDPAYSYPQDGVAVLDPSGRYVLVWRDASRIWHYVDLADLREMQTIATSNNAPRFISDPDYLSLIHEQLGVIWKGTEWLGLGLIVAGLGIAAYTFTSRR